MTKTYITPELVPQGSVAELTTDSDVIDIGDPVDPLEFKARAAGSVGFQF